MTGFLIRGAGATNRVPDGGSGSARLYAWTGGDEHLEIDLAPGELAVISWAGFVGDGGLSDAQPGVTTVDGDEPVMGTGYLEAATDEFTGLTWVTGNGTYGVFQGADTSYIGIVVGDYGLALPAGGDPDPGEVLSVSIGDPGSGYVIGDVLQILQSGAPDYWFPAQVEVDSVDGGGAVLSLHLTQEFVIPADHPSAGYVADAGHATNGTGVGTGLTINVDAVS